MTPTALLTHLECTHRKPTAAERELLKREAERVAKLLERLQRMLRK